MVFIPITSLDLNFEYITIPLILLYTCIPITNILILPKFLIYPSSHRVAITSGLFGQGSGPVQMTNVSCDGSESSIFGCLYNRTKECPTNQTAGVVCTNGKYAVPSLTICILNTVYFVTTRHVFLWSLPYKNYDTELYWWAFRTQMRRHCSLHDAVWFIFFDDGNIIQLFHMLSVFTEINRCFLTV